MSAMNEVLNNIIFLDKNNLYNRIFIVSAYTGVTDWLLENKRTGAPGIYSLIAQHEDFL